MTKTTSGLNTKKIASDFTKLNTLENNFAKTFADNLPFYLEIKNNMDVRQTEIAKYDDKDYLKKNYLKNKQIATQLFDDSIGYRKIISTKKDGSFLRIGLQICFSHKNSCCYGF